MPSRSASLTLVLALVACTPGGDRPEPPRSFPIFVGSKFGFIDAKGAVTVKPEFEYWGPVPGGGAAPATGPNGARIAGRLTDSASVSDGLATSTNRPFDFWLLEGAEDATSFSVATSSSAFASSMQLFEYRDGRWRQIGSSDYGMINHTNRGRARYPLGVRVGTRTYYVYSYPTRWAGGWYRLSLGLNGKRGSNLDFLTELRFREKRMPYRVGDRWGFLAEDGSIAINPQFDSVTAFSNGLAGVRQGQRWGVIDREGSFVIQPTYDGVGPFRDGLIPVSVGRKCGYMDRDGRFAVSPTYTDCNPFREGVGAVRDGRRWGTVDRAGKVLIAPQFEAMTDFHGGHAGVILGERWGLVDREGRIVVNPQYDELIAPAEGALWGVAMGNKYGFIDVEGKFVIGPTLDFARTFDDGVARVRMDDRWGFIKPDGTYLGGSGPTFDEARPMRNGRAAVRVGDRWGFIDREGTMLVAPAYDAVGDFDGDLAAIIQDGMLGYIDRSGRVVRAPGIASDTEAPASATAPPAASAPPEDAASAAGGNEATLLAVLRSDLRNLVTAQEAFYADNTTYGDLAALREYFTPSPGVTVTVTAGARGWEARARHSGSARSCVVKVGTAVVNRGDREGEPTCQ